MLMSLVKYLAAFCKISGQHCSFYRRGRVFQANSPAEHHKGYKKKKVSPRASHEDAPLGASAGFIEYSPQRPFNLADRSSKVNFDENQSYS
jgi:hypothetical protein